MGMLGPGEAGGKSGREKERERGRQERGKGASVACPLG